MGLIPKHFSSHHNQKTLVAFALACAKYHGMYVLGTGND